MNTTTLAARYWFRITIASALALTLLNACAGEPKRVVHRAKDNRNIYHQDDSRKNSKAALKKPYVILVSIDGFRHDYLDKYKPTALSQLAEQGTTADSLIPTYPSKTFPNHYSIVTGLDAGEHGIVGNEFLAKDLDLYYNMRDSKTVSNGQFYGGTPLWVELEKKNILTASMFWVGSEAEIQGVRPTYYFDYDHYYPNEFRIKQVMDWLSLPEGKRPHFITLYFSDVDSAGHRFGPESSQVRGAIERVDDSIATMMDAIKKLDFPVNVIVVSDHGMIDVSDTIDMHEIIDPKDLKDFQVTGRGSHLHLHANASKKNLRKTYNMLKLENGDFNVYLRANSPKRFKLRQQVRFGDIFIESKPGYYMRYSDSKSVPPGSHGWDPKVSKGVHGVYFAKGPDFSSGKKVPSFKNTKVKKIIMNLYKD